MKEFKIKNNVYRIKQMNAIQLLAFKTQINFDDFKKAESLYSLVLENVEVQVNDKWLQVKQGNNYYPAKIENDVEAIEEILNQFLEYLKEVFQKSNELKTNQE